MSRFHEERRFAQKVTVLGRRWRILGDQVLAGLGLSDSTGWCLLYLSRLGADARQSDLARELGVREASLARTLARLEGMGFIERFPNPNDGRANLMRLTEQGQSVVQKIEDLLGQLRSEMLDGISDEHLAIALAVCDTMDARFGERTV
jgi:MarR family transcriptional regulator for hemolysin